MSNTGKSWFARFKAWWNRPGILSSEEITEIREQNDKAILTITRLAADLSATTGISPGEALEMIRKAGNFGSQEEVDRLHRENIRLLEKLAAHKIGASFESQERQDGRMSTDQFENRATFSEPRWGIVGTAAGRGFVCHPSGLPVLVQTKDRAEAELVQRGMRGNDHHRIVEVVVTVIEKPKEKTGRQED